MRGAQARGTTIAARCFYTQRAPGRAKTRPVIVVSHLVKRYGSTAAVDDVSFEVGKGEVVGFLGPNGAGKSTTLRILSGFLGMTSGSVTIAGHDIDDDSFEARKAIGYMPEAVPLYPEMRTVEYLMFRAELKGVARAKRRANVDEAMEKANVVDVATQVIGKLSKGYRQRVGLADALVAKPPLLILDEPTAGLDPNQIRDVRAVVAGLGAEHTVLLSTHILSEVEASCSRVLVIAKGKLVAQGATSEIRAMRRAPRVEITVRGDAAKAEVALAGADGIAEVERVASDADVATFRCATKSATATEDAVSALVAAGLRVREVRAAGGLEEVFAELTKQGSASLAKASAKRE
jgi:ABC-2 type transport system ATP-binding protein